MHVNIIYCYAAYIDFIRLIIKKLITFFENIK